uniref:Uncharacterized protein n=1 Tax=Lactuca sativa TaxID=4236 RepID=A0A9R1WZ26_LACSA|nr:hypothetical protein LSAT_V11C800443750 [Lactuca sativa]
MFFEDEVRSKEGKLDSLVRMEKTGVWVKGPVLLKRTKFLVLDEATASVYTTTDGMIQQTLAQHITFVLDSDMVLVLEQGLIDEYDSPTKLLEGNPSVIC